MFFLTETFQKFVFENREKRVMTQSSEAVLKMFDELKQIQSPNNSSNILRTINEDERLSGKFTTVINVVEKKENSEANDSGNNKKSEYKVEEEYEQELMAPVLHGDKGLNKNKEDNDPRRMSARRSFNRTISELSNKAQRARQEHWSHRHSKELSQKYLRQPLEMVNETSPSGAPLN
ncbi:hypothetical protein RFI_20509, partial [Reticulomyxa filosa]